MIGAHPVAQKTTFNAETAETAEKPFWMLGEFGDLGGSSGICGQVWFQRDLLRRLLCVLCVFCGSEFETYLIVG
jgi:hypothetical protein